MHINIFRSTKTYDYNEGLSCVFRQWRAEGTHCKLLHGYALRFKVTFGCVALDDRNWVQNFGGLKDLRTWLHHMFDHTLVVAKDDPLLQAFKNLESIGLVDLRVLPAVGCEMTAKYVYDWLARRLNSDQDNKFKPEGAGFEYDRVWVESIEVSEHEGNSAIYMREH